MSHLRRAAMAAIILCAGAAQAGDRAVRLQTAPPLRPGVAALPTIADPADDAERRINAALLRLDAAARKAVAGCRTYAGRPGSWRRTVEAPMRGPGYLSLVIRDDSFCDGAHPNQDLMTIVYDLRTGVPVDWTRLLPATLTGQLALQEGSDGTKMVTLSAPRLYALYLAAYRSQRAPADERQACKEAVAAMGDDHPPAMMAWLDARAGGLAVEFGLPNVVQACA